MTAQLTSGATHSPCITWKKRCTLLGMVVTLVAVLFFPAGAVAGAAFQPIGLSVDGGEESWHAEPSFALRWSNPPGVAAVHYRLIDPDGEAVLAEARIGWAATAIQHLAVPPVSGAYTAEVWLEDGMGNEGPTASTRLRFDDMPPDAVAPLEPERGSVATTFP